MFAVNSRPKLKAIFAEHNGIIGLADGDIPWRCKPDMELFKAVTTGQMVLVGATTYKNLAKVFHGREFLPNRTVAVIHYKTPEEELRALVREEDQWRLSFHRPGLTMFNPRKTVNDCLDLAYMNGQPTVWVIGGAMIYDMFADFCNIIYQTSIALPEPLEFDPDKHVRFGALLGRRLADLPISKQWSATDQATNVVATFKVRMAGIGHP